MLLSQSAEKKGSKMCLLIFMPSQWGKEKNADSSFQISIDFFHPNLHSHLSFAQGRPLMAKYSYVFIINSTVFNSAKGK